MKEYKLKIKVTKQILKDSMMCGTKEGELVNTRNCAVALAVREILPNVGVCQSFIDIYNENDNIVYSINDLPIEVSNFITKFDNLRQEPEKRLELPELEFEFEVILPEEYINSINIEEVKEILKGSKTLELV